MSKTMYFTNAAASTHRGDNTAKLNAATSWWTPYLLSEARGDDTTGTVTASAVGVVGPTSGIEVVQSSIPLEWLSEPLSADFTISGLITVNLYAVETDMNLNGAVNFVVDKIAAATGAITQIAKSARTSELTTSIAATIFNVSPTSTVVNRGDRLRVRVIVDDSTANLAAVGQMNFHFDRSTAAQGDSYITFAENLTFEPAGDPGIAGSAGSATQSGLTLFGATTTERIAASFSISHSPVVEVDVWLKKLGTPTDNVVVEIQSDSSGSPSGTVIHTVATISAASLSGTATKFVSTGSWALTPGVTYWLVYRRSGTLDGSNYYQTATSGGTAVCKLYDGAWNAAASSYTFQVLWDTYAVSTYYLTDTAESINPGSATEKVASTARGSGNQGGATTTAAGPTAGIQAGNAGTAMEWYTPPLEAVTFGGKAKCVITARESIATANASLRAEIAVVAGNGTGAVVWGSACIEPISTYGLLGELDINGRVHTAWVAGDDVSITAGQRLRFRFYLDDCATGALVASHTVTLTYNGILGDADSHFILPVAVVEQIIADPLPIGKRAASTTVRGVTLAVSGAAPIVIGDVLSATIARGLTLAAQGTPTVIIGYKSGATTVRGVNLSGLFVMPVGRSASVTVVRGTTLVAVGAATIVIGRKVSATVVRGATPVGAGTVAFSIGSRAAATTVRGATVIGVGTVPITIGKRAAATIVRGVEVKPPGEQVPIGYVPSYASYGDGGYGELPYGGTGIWGVTLTIGAPGFSIGGRASATVVRGVTPAATGTIQLVIGKKTTATTVRGATVGAAGAANLVIGRKASATTVRGATLAATGAANIVIGRKANATTVRGATVVAAGAVTLPIGKSASVTVVRGSTVAATGAVNVVIGKRLVNTTVRGATLTGAGTVTVLVGKVGAAITVRGVTVVSLLINVPIGRVVSGIVRGATVAATGAVTIAIGKRAMSTTVRGATLVPAGAAIVIGKSATATTVRGATLISAGAAPIVIGSKVSATTVRGATVVPSGAAVIILGRKASVTTVRGATLAVAGAASIPIGRVAPATTVRGATLVVAGAAPIVVGKLAAATTVRGLLLAPGVATVPIGRVGGAPALSVTSGLAIHFDASVLGLADGADVTSWTNLANGSLPGAMLGTPLPTLRANALTGKAVVRFTHDNGRVRMTGTGIAADWTLLYVGRLWGTVPGRVVTGIYSPSNILLGYWTTFENVHYDNGFGARTNELPWTTDWKLYSADGTSSLTRSRSFNNGIPMDTVLTAQGWGGTFAISGYDPTGLQETADCEVAEVLMYNRQLGGTERQTVEAYLRTKWIVGGGGTSVRGVTLVPSTVGIPVAKISSTTTVRGIAGLTTSAIVIGKKASTTVVGGIQLTTITPSNVLIGRRVSTTVVRGTSLAVAGSAPIVLGRRAVATTVRGTTLVGAGTVGLAIGRKLNATVVRGTTLAAGGIVNLPIGVRASVTTVRGTTLVRAGEVTLPIGKRVAVTTVRGVTPAAVGTAGLTIGRRASITAVKGATVSGSGTPTIIIGRRAAATTVRGLTTAPGVVQVPIGRRLSTTLVRGIGIVVTGAAPITLGRVIGLTTVIGVSLVPGATVVYLGYRAAFTTVRGLVLAEFGVAYVIPRFVGVYQEPAILLSVSPANGETPIQNFIVDEPRITGVGTYDDEIAPPDYVPDKPHLTGVS